MQVALRNDEGAARCPPLIFGGRRGHFSAVPVAVSSTRVALSAWLTCAAPCVSSHGHSASRMAQPGQHQQETSASSSKSGGGQVVVELCEIRTSGLVFWSRRRFEIGSEIQVRIKRSALPAEDPSAYNTADDPWVSLRGFVVACSGHRRADGVAGFQVSLLVEQHLGEVPVTPRLRSRMCWLRTRLPWLQRFGAN